MQLTLSGQSPTCRSITHASHGGEPSWGSLLNGWADKPVEQKWALCYTSFVEDKTSPAVFHRNCDGHRETLSVVHNAGGRAVCSACTGTNCTFGPSTGPDYSDCSPVGSPCGPTNPGNNTFGAFVRLACPYTFLQNAQRANYNALITAVPCCVCCIFCGRRRGRGAWPAAAP